MNQGQQNQGTAGRWHREFPGDGRQLGVLRRWLESLLPACPARDDVTCVATELSTNALVHTASGGRGGSFAVEITWHWPVVRVAVADCGAPDGPRVVEDPAGEHGRGLVVVRGLSVRTGVCGDQRGRLVWADIPWDDAGAAEPASSQDPYEAAIRAGHAVPSSRFAGGAAALTRIDARRRAGEPHAGKATTKKANSLTGSRRA